MLIKYLHHGVGLYRVVWYWEASFYRRNYIYRQTRGSKKATILRLKTIYGTQSPEMNPIEHF